MRTIKEFWDEQQRRLRCADDYFDNTSPEKLGEDRVVNEALRTLEGAKFFCCQCYSPLYIRRSQLNHFSHYPIEKYPYSEGCEFRTNQDYIRPSSIYSGEGELHKFWKETIGHYLTLEPEIKDLKLERDCILTDENGNQKRKRPDISFKYADEDFAMEVQNSWLSPSDIVARQNFYHSKGIILVWLITEKLSASTALDLKGVSASNVFLCKLSLDLLRLWEKENKFSLTTNYTLFDGMDNNSDSLITRDCEFSFTLEDCLDLYEDRLPRFCLEAIKEERFLSLCSFLSILCQPLNRGWEDHRGEEVMKSHLRRHSQLQIDQGEPSGVSVQKLVRFMASIAVGKVLFARAQDTEAFWSFRLTTAKWKHYLPIFCAMALIYRPSYLFSCRELKDYCSKVDSMNSIDFTSCLGNKKQEVLSYFPTIERRSENESLQDLMNNVERYWNPDDYSTPI
jgi:hypothetical protein